VFVIVTVSVTVWVWAEAGCNAATPAKTTVSANAATNATFAINERPSL